jgi:hypothetical protein
MTVTTTRVVSGADALEAKDLMLETMHMSHVRTGCKVECCIIIISMVRAKRGEVVCTVRPRSHKASKAKGFGGETGEVIKRMGRNSLRELRYKGRRRQGHIPGIRCSVSSV